MKTEHAILQSGIFKLDSKNKPIGIIKLTVNKSLSKINHIPYKIHKLQQMILDLSFEITRYLKPARDVNLLNDFLNDFDKELESLLDRWDLSPNDLTPHYDKLVNKAKRHIKKNELLSDYEKMVIRRDTKKTARRDYMIYCMVNIFREFTKIRVTDILRYISYLLIACEVGTGSRDTFGTIKQAYIRYPKQKS